tara:strand:+ start:5937 stop:7445 length:1509 start_codon:yes stop_codon:yes gene_type:complete
MEYLKHISVLISLLFNFVLSQNIYEGYLLYTPYRSIPGGTDVSATTYLEDINGQIYNSWEHETGPASMAYLYLPENQFGYESTLLYYPCKSENPTMSGGGIGGRVEIYNWAGELLWSYELSNEMYQHHHDIEVLSNGNFLILAYERKYFNDWISAGRISVDNSLNQMWSEAIFEISPNLETGEATIVWEWHLWDHLVQDRSPDFSSIYGEISSHPELMNINCNIVGNDGMPGLDATGDWMHINAIDYNNELKQIVFSSRNMNEIYIIEHSTSSEIAASHNGGIYGKGGDFLYRWGNPSNYNFINAFNQILNTPHGVNWIPKGYPGEGNLILYNNKHAIYSNNTSISAAIELEPPLNNNGTYNFAENLGYGPDSYLWVYTGNGFYSSFQSGAFRNPNGSTLITSASNAIVFEVGSSGEIVWELDIGETNVSISRAEKYGYNYFENVYLQGDLNNDGLINIQDIIGTINIALDIDEYNHSVDMNSDGTINVQDIILLVNIILNS